jgi:hypothetical protein
MKLKALLLVSLLCLIQIQSMAVTFTLTAPNAGGTWTAGNQGTVSWEVAGTNGSPTNSTTVNIWLSVDNGLTFPIPLVLNTPNDGSQTFTVPNRLTTRGRVKVETTNGLFSDVCDVVVGIRAPAGVVATPVITPSNGTSFNDAINIVMTCATDGALIYFTTNGNIPVPGTGYTRVYYGPFAILGSTTIRAIGVRQGFNMSPVAVANYAIQLPPVSVSTPVISPGTGNFASAQAVTISCATEGALIYFTTNGNVPSVGTSFTKLYTGSFIMPGTGTIRAMGVKSGLANSAIAVASLNISTPLQVATPVISPGTGSYNLPQNITMTCPTSGALIYYTTNGIEPIPGTFYTKTYTGPFTLASNTILRAVAIRSSMVQSPTALAQLTISNSQQVATPVIGPGTGSYSSAQTASISCATSGTTIYYTTSGNVPVIGTNFTKVYTGPISINTSTTIRAIAVKSGMTNSNVAAAFITILGPARQAVNETEAPVSQPLEVMPNPTSGKVKVRWNSSGLENMKILVFNALGSEVMAVDVPEGISEQSIDLSETKSGIYFIKTSHHPKLMRIIKQ